MYLESLDEFVHRVFDALPEIVRRTGILAGGALRSYHDGTEVKDFDIFFRSHAAYLSAAAAMETMFTRSGTSVMACAPTFDVPALEAPVNLVGFRHAEPVALVESFDFTACAMAAWLQDTAQGGVAFIAEEDAIESATDKKLTINRVRPTKRLLKRAARYIDRYGYAITDQFIEKFQESFTATDSEIDAGEPDHSS